MQRDGRPEGEPEQEEQVSLMGEAVSGRSVQRKEGNRLRNWGVCGCGTDSCLTRIFLDLSQGFSQLEAGFIL